MRKKGIIQGNKVPYKNTEMRTNRRTISATGVPRRLSGSCIVSYSGNKEYPTNLVIILRPKHSKRRDSLAFS
jgi:hypothetical protein